MPLYVRGDDNKSKQFTSLHGVQRHMVDANKCKMAFDDNEEEYLEFYDWSKLEDELTGTSGLLDVALFWFLCIGITSSACCFCIPWVPAVHLQLGDIGRMHMPLTEAPLMH